MKRNILKDTILLTVIQMMLDGIGLLLNAFMTKHLGAEAIGVLTLTGSFFRLASMIASGNVFLCASRFISEELGKEYRNPKKVLGYCLKVSLFLSIIVSLLMSLTAPWCSVQFLKSSDLMNPIRLMAVSLPLVTVNGRDDVTIQMNGAILELTDLNGTITMDSELEEAWAGDQSANSLMNGEFLRRDFTQERIMAASSGLTQ